MAHPRRVRGELVPAYRTGETHNGTPRGLSQEKALGEPVPDGVGSSARSRQVPQSTRFRGDPEAAPSRRHSRGRHLTAAYVDLSGFRPLTGRIGGDDLAHLVPGLMISRVTGPADADEAQSSARFQPHVPTLRFHAGTLSRR